MLRSWDSLEKVRYLRMRRPGSWLLPVLRPVLIAAHHAVTGSTCLADALTQGLWDHARRYFAVPAVPEVGFPRCVSGLRSTCRSQVVNFRIQRPMKSFVT